jgi:hypothetical protein
MPIYILFQLELLPVSWSMYAAHTNGIEMSVEMIIGSFGNYSVGGSLCGSVLVPPRATRCAAKVA